MRERNATTNVSLVGLAFSVILFALVIAPDRTEALSNPNTGGANIVMTATSTPQRVLATGQGCAVNMQQNDPAYPYPVCAGYRNTLGDGGVGLTAANCFGHMCTGSDRCVTTMVFRDSVPDSVWILAPDPHPDGGVPVRIEMSAGCITR